LKKIICSILVLCMCLAMFASCGKKVNNDPLAQPSEPQTEKKDPSMSILEIDKMPEDTTPKYVKDVNFHDRFFYRKQINMSEGILAQGYITFEVIESKEDLDAFVKEGFYDDSLLAEGSTMTFKDIYDKFTGNDIKENYFETHVMIIVGEYSEYETSVLGTFYKKHDGSYLIRYKHNSNISPDEKIDGGFFGAVLSVNRTMFKRGIPIKEQIEIDDWSTN